MIIGIDGRVFQEREPTGVTRYSLFFIEELGRRYPKARLVIFLAGIKKFTPPEFSDEFARRVTWVRWRVPHLFFNFLSLIFRYPKLDLWLSQKSGQPLDLLVLPNLHFATVGSSVKLLMVVHDLSFLHEPRWYTWKSRIWHWLVMWQGLWQRANLLACVSEITAYDLRKTTGIEHKKISVVPYVVDSIGLKASRMTDEIATPRRASGLAMTSALAIGRVGPRKNIAGLIEGISEWLKKNNVVLNIIGPCHSGLRAGIQTQRNDAKIFFTGYINKEQKQELITKSHILFEISFFEGIGLPICEASGLPQVVSHTTSLPVYAPTQAILVNPYDLAEYPQAAEASLGDLK